jgi:hypothetical protein
LQQQQQQQQHTTRPLLRRMNAFPVRTVTSSAPGWGLHNYNNSNSLAQHADSDSNSSGSNTVYSGGYVALSEEAAASATRMLPDDVVLSVGYQQMLD